MRKKPYSDYKIDKFPFFVFLQFRTPRKLTNMELKVIEDAIKSALQDFKQ